MYFYELKPKFDVKDSFYGKAHVIEEDNGKFILRSYGTDICGWYKGNLTIYWFGYSATTMRHINEFLRQICGLKK